MNNLQQLINEKCKEFEEKFVKPIDSKVRAMNLNGEPYVMGKAGDIELFLIQSLTECAEATADAVRGEVIEKIKKELHEIAVWEEPQPGAGEGLGFSLGTGMYLQYDEDKRKHEEQIRKVLAGIV